MNYFKLMNVAKSIHNSDVSGCYYQKNAEEVDKIFEYAGLSADKPGEVCLIYKAPRGSFEEYEYYCKSCFTKVWHVDVDGKVIEEPYSLFKEYFEEDYQYTKTFRKYPVLDVEKFLLKFSETDEVTDVKIELTVEDNLTRRIHVAGYCIYDGDTEDYCAIKEGAIELIEELLGEVNGCL